MGVRTIDASFFADLYADHFAGFHAAILASDPFNIKHLHENQPMPEAIQAQIF